MSGGSPTPTRRWSADTNLHPFQFPGARVVLAHNGHLREFARMRYALVEHVRPELAQRIEGTTDSEWIYALVLSQLEDPFACPAARAGRGDRGGASHPAHACATRPASRPPRPSTSASAPAAAMVATRFSFDYGWYPPEDEMLETDLPFVSLWSTTGGEYARRDDGWQMTAGDPPRSLIIASEPLTVDDAGWLEVPEYSMLTAELTSAGVEFETRDLDV